ncbi:isoprenoid biosynthesis glyoxalase ElbB [Providencia heimbachae]|uniref:Glyoxalase n=1 Tax=Providencia heimbachae ATCC 35613 TaxID=1354272 RepID=A0A1B7JXV2_9GAMM|nr:isoprenoid biosynthesis glyoxalase ElbB [Providencia heimbachae]MDD9340952.1 isoprenoid biosynthesis glyoxalase ElbB [Providencia heimbachae]OAT52722.1 sigma cross-reacting protein 27A [Providencia heimbachae ATCC 35613]QCJ71295.1 isoprenoid biosynthesis protein ElbB [Providencia heimbachae]SQH14628.1 Sigma cross-reacting protein 27A [Providencia heimbachae]
MKSIAVILCGCGVFDGSEVHESVLTMLALSNNNAKVHFFAPDEFQPTVINHINGELKTDKRNQMEESARISRGEIAPLSSADASKLDALIIPGGFGAAKNLCDFAVKGSDCEINKELLSLVRQMHQQKKPLGLMCIAPVMLPKMLNTSVELTIGNDSETIAEIVKMGGKHIECTVDNIVVDESNKVVTTPAYMLAQSIGEANIGINKLVEKVLEMA